jgi:signal transduction histidine kinase
LIQNTTFERTKKIILRFHTTIILLTLTLLFFSCKKNYSVIFEKNTTVFLDKNYIHDLDKNKKEQYLDSIVNLLRQKKNDSVARNLYLGIATEYYYINNLKKSLSVSLQALRLSKLAKDSVRIAKASFYAGDCYRNSKKDSAYFYYLQAERLYVKLNDYENTGMMLFNIAYVLFYDGNYVESEIEISKALQYLKESNNQRLIYSCNTLMGNCLEKLFDYNGAFQYHELALSNLQKMKTDDIDRDEINNYNVTSVINICNLHDLKGEFFKSIEKLQNLLSEDLKNKWPKLYAKVLSNLAYSKMKNGDYKNVKSMFFESLKIVDSLGIKSEILYKKIRIGEYFLTQKDTIKAIQSLKEANQLAIKIQSNNEILTSSKLLSKLDKKNGLFYANQYIKVSDRIYTYQKNAHNKYARIEYETSRLEDENKVLTKKNFYILIISFVLILLLALIIALRFLKFKNKELRFLQQQQKANDEIYQLLSEQNEKINIAKENEKSKIAKELHDGIMNKIYGVRMNLGFFNSKIDRKIIEKRKEYIFELQNIENEIRNISHDLRRSSFFDSNDFNVLLFSLIENQNVISLTQFKYVIDENFEWSTIQNIYKINLYRIVQEALLNVNKYSNAQNCAVIINRIDDDFLKLTVTDDGNGFNIKKKKSGIGLSNMRERANSLKGQFNIKSKIGNGTKIEVIFNFQTPI